MNVNHSGVQEFPSHFLYFWLFMGAIAKRSIFRLLALTEPVLFGLFNFKINRLKFSSFAVVNLVVMSVVAHWLSFTFPAKTPLVHLIFLQFYLERDLVVGFATFFLIIPVEFICYQVFWNRRLLFLRCTVLNLKFNFFCYIKTG